MAGAYGTYGQPGYNPADPNSGDAAGKVTDQDASYNAFLSNLPQYQANLNNQAVDQGAKSYNNAKQNIDTSANSRGLLYSGLKQGAEAGAANTSANQTQSQIANNNQGLMDYTTNLGNQVSQSNIANTQGNVNYGLQQQGFNMQQNAQNNQMLGGLLQGGMTAAALAMSDKNVKKDIKDADSDADKFVGKLKAKTYKYKDDPKEETHMGILAQDMEKSPMGKEMVVDTPKGKAFDMGKALSAVLAVQSTLDKRLKKKGA